jgi:hypothetical protein
LSQEDFVREVAHMPKVENFSFGSIVIGGRKYGRDILMLPDGVVKQRKGGFWKFGSHVFKKEEIDELIIANPDVVVLGTGTNAKAKLASDAELLIKEANVELMAVPSREAVDKLNRFVEEGKRVSALIHITC